MEQGLIAAGLSAMRTPGIIAQTRCMLRGDDHCLFVISSAFTDERWFGYDAP